MADSADLLFRVKADTGQARDELGRFAKQAKDDAAATEDAVKRVGAGVTLSAAQQARAAEQLQQQRHNALVSVWTMMERDAAKSATQIEKQGNLTDKLIADSQRAIANAQRVAAGAGQSVENTGKKLAVAQQEAASFAGRLSNLASVAIPAGIAIGAVGAAAIGTGTALFTLAQRAAAVGDHLNDLSEKTGLSAESLSAIGLAAEQSGSSVDEFGQAFVLFQKHLTEAATHGKDFFGIDAKKALADQEYALRSLVTLVNGPLPEGYSRSSLMAAVMGKSGANLASTFDTMGASFDRFLEKARRMGVLLTEEDVKAAGEFDDTLKVLSTQLDATANKMALQFAPEMTKGMKDASEAAIQYKDDIITVGRIVGEVLHSMTADLKQMGTYWAAFKGAASGFNFQSGPDFGGAVAGAVGAVSPTGSGEAKPNPNEPRVVSEAGGEGAPATPAQIEDAKKVFERGQRIADQLLAAAAQADKLAQQAQDAGVRAAATIADTAFQSAVAKAQEALKLSGDFAAYVKALKTAEGDRWAAREKQFDAERKQIRATVEDEGLRAAQVEQKDAEERAAKQASNERLKALDRELTQATLAELQKRHARELELLDLRSQQYIEKQKALAQAETITYAEAQRRITAEQAAGFERRRQFLEAEKEAAKDDAEKQAEIIHQLSVLQEQAALFRQEAGGAAASATAADMERLVKAIDRANEVLNRMQGMGGPMPIEAPGVMPGFKVPGGQGKGPMVDPKSVEPPPPSPWMDFGDVVVDVSNRIGQAVGVSGKVVQDVFKGITSAIQQTVAAFGGLAGVGKHLGEFTKAVVRNIAVMAGINAIWEAAQGVAALALSFFWPSMALKAKLHFQAAAMYGIVAAGAGAVSAAIGGPSNGGGGAVAGAAYGGSPNAGTTGATNSYEDFRTRYLREQADKDRNTQREERRQEWRIEMPFNLDGREVARGIVRIVRDGGDVKSDFRNALGVLT